MKKFYLFGSTILLEIFFVFIFFRPISAINVDLGSHLLLGKIIVAQNYVPKVNLLSYTNPNYPFINSGWLSEVVFFLLVSIGGFDLLLFAFITIVSAAFLIQIYYLSKRYSAISILFSTALYILLLSFRGDVRPEIFSMLFMSIFMVLLLNFREKPGKKIFWLILVEIFWVNMHIYFFVGPVLIGLFLIDDLIIHKFHFHQSTKFFLLTFLGTMAASTINPNGVSGALFPLTVLSGYGIQIQENQSIFTVYNIFNKSIIFLPLLYVLALYLLLLLGKKTSKPIDWLLTTVFSVLMIIIFRNLLLFVFATFIPFVKQLDFFVKKHIPQFRKNVYLSSKFFCIVCLCLLLITLTQLLAIASTKSELANYYEGTADFLLKHNINGPIFNSFGLGGYLAYRLYPQLVYVDNRPEAFPKSFFKNIYIPMQEDPSIFEAEDKKYHFNVLTILYWDGGTTSGNKLLNYLASSSEFRPVYLDFFTVIFLRETTTNEALISKLQVTKEKINIRNINNPHALIHYMNFFKKIGWKDKEAEAFTDLKKIDPKLETLQMYPQPNSSNQNSPNRIF